MIIKKYKAPTEKEAMILAKDDLGPEAIVMNVKTIKPNGILKLVKKPRVELTAAIDDNIYEKSSSANATTTSVVSAEKKENYRFGKGFEKEEKIERTFNENSQSASAIEEKINSIARLLEEQISANRKIAEDEKINITQEEELTAEVKESEKAKPENKIIDLVYSQLIENEVKKEFVDNIVSELDNINDNQPLDNILASVYQKIVLKLGQVQPLTEAKNKPKVVFFVGNTGVGKTTTMAKLASKCKLEDKMKIAMLSVDTYRRAAIEQLKIYANILSAPMDVIYTPDDMKKAVEKYSDCDYIFVDTAGRSHRDEKQKEDLQAIIDSVGDTEKEVYLVVSVTVKYSDLISIAKAYDGMFDYKIICTKTDETRGIGNILNLRMELGKSLSYVTWGQNVPDDIGVLNPQVIAKKLLGGEQ